jgi:hypothetical protein
MSNTAPHLPSPENLSQNVMRSSTHGLTLSVHPCGPRQSLQLPDNAFAGVAGALPERGHRSRDRRLSRHHPNMVEAADALLIDSAVEQLKPKGANVSCGRLEGEMMLMGGSRIQDKVREPWSRQQDVLLVKEQISAGLQQVKNPGQKVSRGHHVRQHMDTQAFNDVEWRVPGQSELVEARHWNGKRIGQPAFTPGMADIRVERIDPVHLGTVLPERGGKCAR